MAGWRDQIGERKSICLIELSAARRAGAGSLAAAAAAAAIDRHQVEAVSNLWLSGRAQFTFTWLCGVRAAGGEVYVVHAR